jgi:hypothetical protein
LVLNNYLVFFLTPKFTTSRVLMTIWAVHSLFKAASEIVVLDPTIFEWSDAKDELNKYPPHRNLEDYLEDISKNVNKPAFERLFELFASTLERLRTLKWSIRLKEIFERSSSFLEDNNLGIDQRLSLEQLSILDSMKNSQVHVNIIVNCEWRIVDESMMNGLGWEVVKRTGNRNLLFVMNARPGSIRLELLCQVAVEFIVELENIAKEYFKKYGGSVVEFDAQVLSPSAKQPPGFGSKNWFCSFTNDFAGLKVEDDNLKQLKHFDSNSLNLGGGKYLLDGVSSFYHCPVLFFAWLDRALINQGEQIWRCIHYRLSQDLIVEISCSKKSFDRMCFFVENTSMEQRQVATKALKAFFESSLTCLENLKHYAFLLNDQVFQARIFEAIRQCESMGKVFHWEFAFPRREQKTWTVSVSLSGQKTNLDEVQKKLKSIYVDGMSWSEEVKEVEEIGEEFNLNLVVEEEEKFRIDELRRLIEVHQDAMHFSFKINPPDQQ